MLITLSRHLAGEASTGAGGGGGRPRILLLFSCFGGVCGPSGESRGVLWFSPRSKGVLWFSSRPRPNLGTNSKPFTPSRASIRAHPLMPWSFTLPPAVLVIGVGVGIGVGVACVFSLPSASTASPTHWYRGHLYTPPASPAMGPAPRRQYSSARLHSPINPGIRYAQHDPEAGGTSSWSRAVWRLGAG